MTVVRACCSWEDFEAGVLRVFERAGIDALLIDWPEARTAWGRYSATSGEFSNAAINKIKAEGDYMFAVARRK